MMTKERASGMYRLSAFYLARSASDIPADLTIPSIFIAITCEGLRGRGQGGEAVAMSGGRGSGHRCLLPCCTQLCLTTSTALTGLLPARAQLALPLRGSPGVLHANRLLPPHASLPLQTHTPDLMTGLRHGGYFFLNWLSVLLSTLVAQGFGLFIGATVMNAKTAQTICAVIMLTFMLVGEQPGGGRGLFWWLCLRPAAAAGRARARLVKALPPR